MTWNLLLIDFDNDFSYFRNKVFSFKINPNPFWRDSNMFLNVKLEKSSSIDKHGIDMRVKKFRLLNYGVRHDQKQ